MGVFNSDVNDYVMLANFKKHIVDARDKTNPDAVDVKLNGNQIDVTSKIFGTQTVIPGDYDLSPVAGRIVFHGQNNIKFDPRVINYLPKDITCWWVEFDKMQRAEIEDHTFTILKPGQSGFQFRFRFPVNSEIKMKNVVFFIQEGIIEIENKPKNYKNVELKGVKQIIFRYPISKFDLKRIIKKHEFDGIKFDSVISLMFPNLSASHWDAVSDVARQHNNGILEIGGVRWVLHEHYMD